jgi:hypothetical protein
LLTGKPNPITRVWQCWRRSGESTIGGVTVLNQDFKEFIKSLNDSHVRYLIIGGYALEQFGSLGLQAADFLVLNQIMGYPPNRVDLITTLPWRI